jgi:hypothetical protein
MGMAESYCTSVAEYSANRRADWDRCGFDWIHWAKRASMTTDFSARCMNFKTLERAACRSRLIIAERRPTHPALCSACFVKNLPSAFVSAGSSLSRPGLRVRRVCIDPPSHVTPPHKRPENGDIMTQLIARLYGTSSTAGSAADALEQCGFTLVRTIAGDGACDVAQALAAAGISEPQAATYRAGIAEGQALVLVTPPFGSAKLAIATLETFSPVGGDDLISPLISSILQADAAAPFSAALGWPVLLDNPTPFSSLMGWSVLKPEPATSDTLNAIRAQSNDPAPLSRRLGWAVLWDKATPFSSWLGLPVLSRDAAPFSSKLGWKLLSDNPTPLSSLLGWSTLSRNAAAFSSRFGWKLLIDNPTPFSSLLGWPVLLKD